MKTGRRTFESKEKKPPEYPRVKKLTAALSTGLRHNGYIDGNLTVLERKPNPYGSTFPTEVVTCRPDGGAGTLRLFVKYGTREFDSVYGHRGNVSYEAKVYREVLQPLRTSTPRARWLRGVPDGFEDTLGVARVHMNLRRLGDPGLMSPLVPRRGRPLVSNNVLLAMQAVLHLHSVGERLGLL